MARFHRVIAAAVSAGVISAIALTGCSSDSDSESDNGGTPDLALLAEAADNTEALTGAHFQITVDGDLQGLNVSSIEGDVTNTPADAAQGDVTLRMGPEDERTTPFIYIDGAFYAKASDDSGYTNYIPDAMYDPSVLLNPEQGLANVLRSIEEATEDGSEDIDGVSTTKVTGVVPPAALARLSGSVRLGPDGELPDLPDDGSSVNAEVWITDDGQIARLIFEPESPQGGNGGANNSEAEEVTMTINLSEWNKTVEVQAPSDDEIDTPTEAPDDADDLDETRAPIGG